MSDVPSWLNEENISTATKVANNPAARSAVAGKINAPPPPPPPKASSYTPPTPSGIHDVESPAPQSSRGGDPSSEFVIEEETLKSMQNWHLALRLSYMAAAIFMAVAAALSLQSQKDLGLIFFALYVLFFSTMICCFEFNLHVSPDDIFRFCRS